MTTRNLLASAVLLASIGSVGATTLVELDFDQLAAQADLVAVATVTSLEGRWEPSHTFIHTDVTLEVDRYLVGKGDARITVRTPGGQADGVAMVAQGAPSFTVGEKVLLFLTTWEDGALKVLGYAQGKSRVVRGGFGEPRLEGGTADGRSLAGVESELRHGSDYALPLRPVR